MLPNFHLHPTNTTVVELEQKVRDLQADLNKAETYLWMASIAVSAHDPELYMELLKFLNRRLNIVIKDE